MDGRGRAAAGFRVLGVVLLCALVAQCWLGEDRWCYVADAHYRNSCANVWPLVGLSFLIGAIGCFIGAARVGRRANPPAP